MACCDQRGSARTSGSGEGSAPVSRTCSECHPTYLGAQGHGRRRSADRAATPEKHSLDDTQTCRRFFRARSRLTAAPYPPKHARLLTSTRQSSRNGAVSFPSGPFAPLRTNRNSKFPIQQKCRTKPGETCSTSSSNIWITIIFRADLGESVLQILTKASSRSSPA